MSPRIAVACSGLGRVRRGNETWAVRLGEALAAAGADVSIFGGARPECAAPFVAARCWPRDLPVWRLLVGFGARYIIEQKTFTRSLAPKLRRGGFHIVHTGDPQIAWFCRRALASTTIQVVYKDGLLLGPAWNRNFRWVQALSPWALDAGREAGVDTSGWRVVPHFADVARFQPRPPGDRPWPAFAGPRPPAGSVVFCSVGAVGAQHGKRWDYLSRELAGIPHAVWLAAGHAEPAEAIQFEADARPAWGDRARLLTNVRAETMPEIYRAADIFAHAALREPFGIVFLEAMACGLPALAHEFPVTQWIIGAAGRCSNLTQPGALKAMAEPLAAASADRAELSALAAARATEFSPARVVPLYLDWYAQIRAAAA